MFSNRFHAALIAGTFALALGGTPAKTDVLLTGAGPPPGAAGGCATWTTVSARLSGSENVAAYQTFICGLVTDGLYTSCDAIYVPATDSLADGEVDLSANNVTATQTATVTFTANAGIVGNGSSGKWAGKNLSTMTHYTQNSASLHAYLQNTAQSNGSPIGATGGNNYTQAYEAGGNVVMQVNSGSAISVAAISPFYGLYSYDRSSSSVQTIYYNGASRATGGGASAAVDNFPLMMLGSQGGNYSGTQSYGFFAACASFGATNEAAFYSRVHTLLHAINATNFP